MGALRCLADGHGDVAFTELGTFLNFTQGKIVEPWVFQVNSVALLCPFGRRFKHEADPCYMHWVARGNLMIHKDMDTVRRNEIYNSMREMDKLFGKQYKTNTIPFTMFGPFDRQTNVMFRDTTDGLRSEVEMGRDRLPRLLSTASMNQYMESKVKCVSGISGSTSIRLLCSVLVVGPLLAVCSWLIS